MNKYYDNNDLRILRTKKLLTDTLLELLSEKEFQAITVSELTKKAGINRKTFYLHYSSTRDLLDEIQDEILDEITKIMEKYNFLDAEFHPYPMFVEFNRRLQESYPVAKALLFAPNEGISITKVKKAFINFSKSKYKNHINIDPVRMDFYLDYTIAGLLAIYVSWLSHKPPLVSTEELAKIACEICYQGLDEIMEGFVQPTNKTT